MESLRAIGTTRAQLLLMLLMESLATYLLGAAAALGLGIAAGAALVPVLRAACMSVSHVLRYE